MVPPFLLFSVPRLKSKSLEYFVIGFFHIPQIPAEAVLIQFFVGVYVPQPAGIGRYLVGQKNLSVVTAELNLKVNQLNVRLQEIRFQNIVYLKGEFLDGVDFLPGGKSQRDRKIAVDKGVA